MKLKVRILCPAGIIYEDQAVLLVLPGTDGEFGVMYMHEKAIIQLSIGNILLFNDGYNDTIPNYSLNVTSGYVHIKGECCDVVITH